MSTSVFDGLAALRQYETEKENRSNSRTNWFKIDDGESVDVLFLQEMDESSDRYIPEMGKVLFALEHSNPDIFWRRVVCTNNEDHDGQCWPCQKNQQMWDGNRNLPEDSKKKYAGAWKAKINMYVNVLVRDKDGNETFAVLSRTKTSKSYVDDLILDAMEEGYISNRWYRIARTGAKTDTVYRLKALKDAERDLTEYADKLVDLSTLVKEVPYALQRQELGVTETVAPVTAEAPEPSGDSDNSFEDW